MHRVWQHVASTPAPELAADINRQRGEPPSWLHPSGRWPDRITAGGVELARRMLGDECAQCAAGAVADGCIGDGTCVCKFGWTGADCATECSGGWERPCSNNGLCMEDGSCLCDDGWTGLDCSIECAGGHTSPCSFNGDCQIDGSCQCYYGYRGAGCQHQCPGIEARVFTGPSSWECSGRGACDVHPHQDNASATCVCDLGYAGLDCRFSCPGFEEAAGICFEHGFCLANLAHIRDDGGRSFYDVNGWPPPSAFPRPLGSCVCDSGYRGDACHLRCPGNVPPHNASSCNGHGACLADASCDCQAGSPPGVDAGWRGVSCHIECNGGADNVCNGHGRCQDDGSCACEAGWRLSACQRECPGGHATPCSGNGLCTSNGSCLCEGAFRLDDCSKMCPGGPSVTNICSRHGVCDATGTCQCEVGWSGTACNILDEWVVACLVILGLGICTTATFLMRWQYHARQRSRRRARREVRQKRQGRVLRVTGKRTGGYTVQAPGELAGQM